MADDIKLPSDESINELWRECVRAWNQGKTDAPLVQQFARALLSRYSSSQPATDIQHDTSEDGCTDPENCRRCQTLPEHRGDMQHAGIGRYPSKPAASAEPWPDYSEMSREALERHAASMAQALADDNVFDDWWQELVDTHAGTPPGAPDKHWAFLGFRLGWNSASVAAPVAQEPAIPATIRDTIQRALVGFHDAELERQRALQTPEKKGVSIYGAARIAAQRNMDDADAALNWLATTAAAPVAQEPVSVTERWQDGDDSNMVSRVEAAAPVAAQDREDAKRYTWLRDHPPKDCQGGMRVRIWGESGDWTSISGEKLDVAIDAARAANGADHD